MCFTQNETKSKYPKSFYSNKEINMDFKTAEYVKHNQTSDAATYSTRSSCMVVRRPCTQKLQRLIFTFSCKNHISIFKIKFWIKIILKECMQASIMLKLEMYVYNSRAFWIFEEHIIIMIHDIHWFNHDINILYRIINIYGLQPKKQCFFIN